jgi:uncharacterized protein (DUF2147 family)
VGRVCAALASAAALLIATAGNAESTPAGLWWAEGGAAQVEIAACGEALCGRVVWLRAPFDPHGCPVRDERNPEPGLRGRPLIGVVILRDLRPDSNEQGVWSGGEVYDPASGRTFRVRLELESPDRLALRGYLGLQVLGRTARWIRVGRELQCRDDA